MIAYFVPVRATGGQLMPDFVAERLCFVCVTDLDIGGRSVTNGIEDVIARLFADDMLHRGDRLIYRDSDGIWDEVLLDDFLAFRDFRRLNAKTRDEAIARVLELENGQ